MDLRIDNVSHTYGSVEVLRDISLEIPQGQIVCLIGPSGCGKSTLLRFLGGLEMPSKGAVLQIGEPAKDTLNPLTYVFQHFALLPWRTVEGNIRLVLEDHRIGRAEMDRIITDVLARTRLSDFRTALPKQLSGGMKQRVAIARALAVRPAVMLMDDLVSLWTRQTFTAVYVTHNLAEAVRLGHRIVVLSRRPGRIREIVEIDMPLDKRTLATPELEAKQKQLWDLMREEAAAADQELLDV